MQKGVLILDRSSEQIVSIHSMKAYEHITQEQLNYEYAVGPPVNYRDRRIGTIVKKFLSLENFYNETKKETIDGIPLESSGSLTGPKIIEEDGKRKLSYVSRPVNPHRYHNPVCNLRHWDNVIIPQAYRMVNRNPERLKTMKFVGLDVKLKHDDLDLMYRNKPCLTCPIEQLCIEQFKGEDLKTHTFDNPGKKDNIDTLQLDAEKFWAICVYLNMVVLKLLRPQYPDNLPSSKVLEPLSKYLANSFISGIEPEYFNNELELPKNQNGKYDLDLWPSPTDESFFLLMNKLVPSLQTDPKLNFLTSSPQKMIE